MDNDIEDLSKSYSICQQASTHSTKAPLKPWEWLAQPWNHLNSHDFAGPFLGYMYYFSNIAIVDVYSRWLSAANVVNYICTIRYSPRHLHCAWLPQKIVTGNGLAFTNANYIIFIFKGFVNRNGIKHIGAPPYHPFKNCLAERVVQTFNSFFNKLLEYQSRKQNYCIYLLPQGGTHSMMHGAIVWVTDNSLEELKWTLYRGGAGMFQWTQA